MPPAASVWNGSANTDWYDPANWSNGLPGSVTNVTIPAGLTNYPTITSLASCQNIAIASGASILDHGNLQVNFKNTTVYPTWNDANGSGDFVAEKGYLIEYQGDNIVKQFEGSLNHGNFSPLLSKSGAGEHLRLGPCCLHLQQILCGVAR